MKTKNCPFMKQPCILLLMFVFSSLSTTAFAEIDLTGMYAGFIFSNSDYRLDSGSSDDLNENWGHLKGKFGTSLNELFSAEGQLGITSNTDSDQGVISFGGYLRVGKNLGQYKPYGLLGFTGLHIYDDTMDDSTESGFSYGAGIEIFGSKDITVTFEYLRLLDKSVDDGDLTFDTFGVGFTYYFTDDTSYFNKNRNKIRSIRY